MPENQLRILRESDALALPATTKDVLDKLYAAQDKMLQYPQMLIMTEHVLHAGIYSRTVTLPPTTAIVGVLIKRSTLVITVGSGFVLVGQDWAKVDGYQILPASANRKQAFVSRGPLIITMLFPSAAKTVREAEEEFTDETDDLLSRRQDLNSVVITGE